MFKNIPKAFAGLLLLLAFVVAGAILVSASIGSLTRSMFGPVSTPSRSMEPYEIVLRTTFGGGKKLPADAKPYEWRLILPRAFMNVEIGANGGVNRGNSDKGSWWFEAKSEDFFVFLNTVVNLKSNEVNPEIFAEKKDVDTQGMTIELGNSGLFPDTIESDYCIRDDDYDPSLIKSGYPTSWRRCDPSTPRCSINTSIDGWDIQLIVSREIYNKPKEACAAAQRFLAAHTVQRDNVR